MVARGVAVVDPAISAEELQTLHEGGIRVNGRRVAKGAFVAEGDRIEVDDEVFILSDMFDAEPGRFFSEDRFHPSTEGYAACAHALLPEVLAAVGITATTPRPALPSA